MNEERPYTADELIQGGERLLDAYQSGVAYLHNEAGQLDIVEWSNWVNAMLKEQVDQLGRLTSFVLTQTPDE